METIEQVRSLIGSVLHLGSRTAKLDRSTVLIGSMPEFDSVAVISLVTAIEEHFGLALEDDDINAEIFENVGSLCDFIDAKL